MSNQAKNFIVAALILIAVGAVFGAFIVYSPQNSPSSTSINEFSPGIYFRMPSVDSGEAALYQVSQPSGAQMVGEEEIRMSSAGFDINKTHAVFADGNAIVLVSPDGKTRRVVINELDQIARPSFSPDGKKVSVQAIKAGDTTGDLNIYTVDLGTGDFEQISKLPVNEESPEWFPNKNWIAYSSFSPEEGVNMHIYDLDQGKEILEVKDAGAIHLSVSEDGSTILDPGRFLIYDNKGALLADYRQKLIANIENLGFELDDRFPGQANRGIFPLDGDFSPDGNHIVFDGAVKKDGKYGAVLFSSDLNGDNVQILSSFIPVNPSFSNNHNFSQLNPEWL